jgi:Mg/Co/Ni transporter MgtE
MAIGDVMRTRVVTVNTDDSARLAVLRMLEEGVGSVAVCEGGKLIGIFTERDVLGLAGEGTDLDAVRVGDVMTREPLTVDVGVVCLWLGRVAERRFVARRLAAELIQRADRLMYEAKDQRANHIYLARVKIDSGALVEIPDGETP